MTDEWNLPIRVVAPLVLLHVSLRPEGFAARERASKGLQIQVNTIVNVEVRLLAEAFAAARVLALEGLRPEMQVSVRHELLQSLEDFATASEVTKERLLRLVDGQRLSITLIKLVRIFVSFLLLQL